MAKMAAGSAAGGACAAVWVTAWPMRWCSGRVGVEGGGTVGRAEVVGHPSTSRLAAAVPGLMVMPQTGSTVVVVAIAASSGFSGGDGL